MPITEFPEPIAVNAFDNSAAFRREVCQLLDQALIKLRNCLSQLDDQQVWWRPDPALNSIGNLVLHMCGNLRQWSTGFFNRPDDRDRDQEFAAKDGHTAAELMQLAQQSVKNATQIIDSLTDQQLAGEFIIQGFQVSGLKATLHTATHFVGHAHQIILLTRLQLGSNYRFAWSPADSDADLPI